ncbi:MAG: hypothetical protein ACYTKD_00435 [Planctomycetota bacterium]|jgi:hypothetical protein
MGKLRLKCPECGRAVSVAGRAKKARCPKCKAVFEVGAALAGDLDPSTELTGPAWAGQGKGGRARGAAATDGERTGGDPMPYDKNDGTASGGDDRPFGGKVDDIVGKAIPQKWLATAFSGAAVLAFLFFILMIIGFMTGERLATDEEAKGLIKKAEDTAAAKVTRYEDIAKKAREEQDTAKKELSEALSKLRVAERKVSSSDSEIASAVARRDKVQGAFDALKQTHAALQKSLNDETRAKREAESKLRTAERERDAAKAKEAAIATRLTRTETGLKDLHKEHDVLRRQKEDDSKRVADAKAAFDSIMNKAAAEDDLAKRLELLRELRDESLTKLGGTAYARSLGDEMIRVEQMIEKQEVLAKRKTTRKAGEAYSDAMRRLKMTKEHARAMDILRETKEEVAGTKYEVSIHEQMVSREKAEKERLARAVYDAARRRLSEEPNAYEENLRALKAAMEETAGTRYAASLKKMVDAREASLQLDIARGAYETLSKQIRKSPPDYDANITVAEDALAKAKGTRYEAKITSILKSQQERRLEAIGRAAYDACIKQVKGSRDYAANVAELEAQKEKASGSPYEPKIDKLLAGQKKYLARERARNQ